MSDKAPELSWGHININVSNLEESIAFYQKLGFSMLLPGIPYLDLTSSDGSNKMPGAAARALAMPVQSEGRACIMQLDEGFPKIDLVEWSGADQQPPLSNADLGLVRFCLASQDLATDYATLVEQGVNFLSEPQSTKDGKADIAVCVDPDGSLIELIQIYFEKW
jgi:catechol 2,3-dioxygenase-like lactoylglutathione lyase family enzyme